MITRATASKDKIDPFVDPETIAIEAYVYLYPLVLMDLTRRQSTNVEQWDGKHAFGPMNTFAHFRTFPSLDFKTVVRPNFDTLYSIAWLDLRQEPMIVSIPGSEGRYYLMPTLDMWTDAFASPGWRTTGTKEQHYGYCAPGWLGELPKEVVRIDVPTPIIWIIGRVQTDGEKDYEAVHRFQDGLQVRALSRWGQTPTAVKGEIDPSVDMATPPMKQVEQMSGEQFFRYAAELLKHHRPHRIDHNQVWRLERIGIVRGQDYDFDQLDPALQKAVEQVPAKTLKLIRESVAHLGSIRHGWQVFTEDIGVYGIGYLTRAVIAMLGLGANQAADAVYPQLLQDAAGNPLSGEAQYVLHFESSELPPADAFWSLTLYDTDGYPVPNELNRGNLSSWMKLSYHADGSLDLYFQPDSPGDGKQTNWLPTPRQGAWNLTMRLYAPRAEVLQGLWVPPAIQRLTTKTAAAGHAGSRR